MKKNIARCGNILPIFLVVISTIALEGCFGDGSDDDTVTSSSKVRVFETSEISIDVPFDWEVMTPKDFTSEIPANTLAAFRNNVKSTEFTANINIIKNDLPEAVSSIDYAKGLIQKHQASVVNFRELDRQEVAVQAGADTYTSLFVIFEGKESEEASMKEFAQVSVVKGDVAYIATGASLASDDATVKQKLRDAVTNLQVK